MFIYLFLDISDFNVVDMMPICMTKLFFKFNNIFTHDCFFFCFFFVTWSYSRKPLIEVWEKQYSNLLIIEMKALLNVYFIVADMMAICMKRHFFKFKYLIYVQTHIFLSSSYSSKLLIEVRDKQIRIYWSLKWKPC